MVMSAAKTVDEYLASLPEDRRAAIDRVRGLVLRNLPAGYEEGMDYGMIYYSIPLSRYPNTYNRQPLGYVGLAAQKNFNAIYLMGVYSDAARAKRFKDGFAKAGKKLDVGKSCVRFKSPDDLSLDTVAETIATLSVDDFIALYERSRSLTQKDQAVKQAQRSAVRKVVTRVAKNVAKAAVKKVARAAAKKVARAVVEKGAKTMVKKVAKTMARTAVRGVVSKVMAKAVKTTARAVLKKTNRKD